ncbi:MAG: CoA pyrophosphatase [Spirochaetes bacterium]|nr:CoA pyrophosphatase [Spirochaetota bacterium]
MKMSFDGNADFAAFKEELRKRLASRASRDLGQSGLRHSAVMMLIMDKGGAPHVVLTRRTDSVSSHKGQVSFPGGAVDADDGDFLSAAYRETEEEIGVGRDSIEYIGQFDDYVSISGYHVTCFVGAVAYPCCYTPNTSETESVFEAPLSIFVNKDFDRTEIVNYLGKEYRVFYYLHEGYLIWGLTARILTDFGEKICRD